MTEPLWKPGEHRENKLVWDGALVMNDLDGSILLLDSATGNQTRQIAVPGPGVRAMAFAPDGKTLAATTGWEEGRIRLYETATGKEMRTISTPPLRKSALTFTPDGSRVITGMTDTSVLVWELRTDAVAPGRPAEVKAPSPDSVNAGRRTEPPRTSAH